jgi:AraC-like DNA-binding protein
VSEHAIRAPSVTLRRFEEASAADVHDFHQVVLGLDGAMEMAVDGTAQRIDKRYAWLVPAGSRHEYAGIGENRQVVLDLSPASLAVPERLFARPLVITLDNAFAQLVADVAAARTGSPYARPFAWDAATRLAAALATASGVESPAVGLDFPRIDRWLRAHLAEPLRVPDLAMHCGFGTRRFHQLFEEAFGTTPHRYLQRLRLDTALALLRDPRNTLADVALAVGFGDQSAFTHAFTRRFGRAPGQWRALRAH